MKNKSIGKRALRIAGNVLLYTFLAVAVVTLVLTVLSKRDHDGAATLFGYQMRVVTSDSMAACDATDVAGYAIKSIPVRSMVFVEMVPQDADAAASWYDSIREGDVLTFRYVYTSQVTITHRVTSITPKETGGYIIVLEGDNKASDSNLLTQVIDTSETESPNYVIGRVVGQSYVLGFLVSMISQPVGLVLTVIVPSFLVILLEVIKIIGIVNADKKQREQEKQKEKDDEIEALKLRLAALEQTTVGVPQDGAGDAKTGEAPQAEEGARSCPLPKEEPSANAEPEQEAFDRADEEPACTEAIDPKTEEARKDV